ncbi:hypothetical protein CDD82_2128 [Ophiocordyceps australis]|uniref:Uncharacterized protein n=1 Tax=Ophiocordyceps australis TaxID=1399860 RepID=A0A2C5ZKF2_9HYPO|nr:hypothetical protein CDD82_2128 [Ophiocordyceps australis]
MPIPSKTQLDQISSINTSLKAWLAETAIEVPTAWRNLESPVLSSPQMSDGSKSLSCNSSARSWVISEFSQEEQGMSSSDKGPARPPTDGGSSKDSKTHVGNDFRLPGRNQPAPGGKIGRWLKEVTPPPSIVLNVRAFGDMSLHDQELDVCTGEFLPPIEQPEVLYQALDGPCLGPKDIAWRRFNMTSELFVARTITIHAKLDKTSEEVIAEEATAEEASFEEASFEETTKYSPIMNESPRPDLCRLRSVVPRDYEQIANIMNLELKMEHSPQVFEDGDFKADDVAAMDERCKLNRRPFIVALLPDPLMDRTKWPLNSLDAYQAYVRYKQTQEVDSLIVVGFAVVQEARFGFKETVDAGSRLSGQIRIIVHPDWRQRRVGSALMDRILCLAFPGRLSLGGYEWLYDASGIKNRYSKLYLELFCEGKRDENLVWRESLLYRSGFFPVGYLPGAVKAARGGVNRWLDLGIWEYATEQQP